jgi:hypothetical protein
MTLASIIITTHDRPQLLVRAVESARLARVSVEIVVVDDASGDETRAVCQRLTGIKYVRVDRQQGVAGARNIGLIESSGEYLTFLDDDDLRLAGSLERQVELLEANADAGLVYGQAICLDQMGQATPRTYPRDCPEGDVFWDLLEQNFIPCGSVVFRRSCLERVGLLDDDLAGIDDWDLWIRIAELYPVIACKEPVMQWRRSSPVSQQGSSKAGDIVSKSKRQFQHSWMKLPRAVRATSRVRHKAWRQFSTNMAAHLSWETVRSVRHRNAAQGFRNISALPQLGPFALTRLVRRYGDLNSVRKVIRGIRENSALEGVIDQVKVGVEH